MTLLLTMEKIGLLINGCHQWLQSNRSLYSNRTTNPETELFTGTPQLGHVFVLVTCQVPAQEIGSLLRPWVEKG